MYKGKSRAATVGSLLPPRYEVFSMEDLFEEIVAFFSVMLAGKPMTDEELAEFESNINYLHQLLIKLYVAGYCEGKEIDLPRTPQEFLAVLDAMGLQLDPAIVIKHGDFFSQWQELQEEGLVGDVASEQFFIVLKKWSDADCLPPVRDIVENWQFWQVYSVLAEQGKCDDVGGCEFYSVLAAWKKAGEPDDIAAFIIEEANAIPPDDAE